MLADPNGPAAGISFDFDTSKPFPWKKNRQDRAVFEAAWSSKFPPSKYGYERRQVNVTMRDGADIPVMIYKPKDSEGERLPLMFVTHGGGWYLGSSVLEEMFIMRPIMSAFRVVIVSPEFRLAPEHRFPIPLNDCWDAFLWALRNSDSLGIDRQSVLLAGSSCGGPMIAAIGLRAGNAAAGDASFKREVEDLKFGTETKVEGIFMNVSSVCHPDFYPPGFTNKSFAEAKSGTTLFTGEEMSELWKLYQDPHIPNQGANPEMSPLLADLHCFPPSCLYIAGQDPLRDEQLAFAQKLKASGRPVKYYLYPGVPHAFGSFDDLEETKVYWEDVRDGIGNMMKWL